MERAATFGWPFLFLRKAPASGQDFGNSRTHGTLSLPSLIAMEAMMAVLNIRNLPDDIRDRLRVRAARRGRSMEAEARAILTAAVSDSDTDPQAPSSLPDWVDRLYGKRKPKAVVDALIAERRRESRRK
jgi:hypothetical protein